jgi:hypothetical protein
MVDHVTGRDMLCRFLEGGDERLNPASTWDTTLFHNTSILTTITRYMDHIVREAIEIELHPNNMNRDVGFCLSKSGCLSYPTYEIEEWPLKGRDEYMIQIFERKCHKIPYFLTTVVIQPLAIA